MTRQTDDDVEPLSLSDLHGAYLIYEDADGETRRVGPMTCGKDECDVCGGQDSTSDTDESEEPDDYTFEPQFDEPEWN